MVLGLLMSLLVIMSRILIAYMPGKLGEVLWRHRGMTVRCCRSLPLERQADHQENGQDDASDGVQLRAVCWKTVS
jgi:hypothetical protein